MVLCDWQIREMTELVAPYDPGLVNPASIDLRLGSGAVDLTNSHAIAGDVVRLLPGVAVLATTLEYVRLPGRLAGMLLLKSSMCRRGVMMSAAGWVDPGFHGQLTVLLSSMIPVQLEVGKPFIQMVLKRTDGRPEAAYNGRYQGQVGVTLERVTVG